MVLKPVKRHGGFWNDASNKTQGRFMEKELRSTCWQEKALRFLFGMP